MTYKKWIAVDWDHTLFRTSRGEPMPDAHEFVDYWHARGFGVMVHSCNFTPHIRELCEKFELNVDDIWDRPGKPIASVYIDDRGITFHGSLMDAAGEASEHLEQYSADRLDGVPEPQEKQ